MTVSTNIIKQCFKFLVDDYGYLIGKEFLDPEGKIWYDEVLYQSKMVNINVEVDRTYVALQIGRRESSEEEWLDFQDVMRVFAPKLEDVYLLQGDINSIKFPKVDEIKLGNLSKLLQQYCEPLIKGDFSMEERIRDIGIKRKNAVRDDLMRRSQENIRKMGLD